MKPPTLSTRVEQLIHHWNVVPQDILETQSSFIVFGTRGDRAVVIKVLRESGDEWECGEVLEAFDGRGIVRLYERVEGAVLIERLIPGTSLAGLALNGSDDEATEVLARVIHRMSRPTDTLARFTSVENWGKGFGRYLERGDRQIPRPFVERGGEIFRELCASQHVTGLLHGDLHHHNVLFDRDRGWLAVDPKGVVGELEYELGASFRNPFERPDLFTSPKTVERRVRRFEADLGADPDRTLRWAFAQGVLSAIWTVEDGWQVDETNPPLVLAKTIEAMLA